MNVLVLNTASGAKAYLQVGDKSYYMKDDALCGAEAVMPLIDSVLKEAHLTIKDIDTFGVCVGPGSFTGLRIGLATIKSFCYVLNRPTFTFTHLEFLTYNIKDCEKVLSVCDAGHGAVYCATYDKARNEIVAAQCMTVDGCKKLLDEGMAVVSDEKCSEYFAGAVTESSEYAFGELIKKYGTRRDEIQPLYLRKPQPERKEGEL